MNLKIPVFRSSKNFSVTLLSCLYSDSSSIRLRGLLIHMSGYFFFWIPQKFCLTVSEVEKKTIYYLKVCCLSILCPFFLLGVTLFLYCICYMPLFLIKKLSCILKQYCSASIKAVKQKFSLQIVTWQTIMESFHFPGIVPC